MQVWRHHGTTPTTIFLNHVHFLFSAKDLLRLIKQFFKTHKEFRKTPTYLFGQSYGSKLCPRLGYYLYTVRSFHTLLRIFHLLILENENFSSFVTI